MAKQDYFFDAHCHLFTAADIPLYQLVKRLHRKAQHPLRLFLAPAAIALLSVKQFREFIQFFESEPRQNVARVTAQLQAALKSQAVPAKQVLMTPLVMDFDAGGKVNKLLPQVKRLVDACGQSQGVTILPFVGVDPRRFLGEGTVQPATIRRRIKVFLDANHVAPVAQRGGWQSLGKKKGLANGDLIGVKLYPPLGFDVLPEDKHLRDCHLEIYRELVTRDLPVTVHCQEASFELASSHKIAMEFTKPGNWRRVLEFTPRLGKLRLNFGHFGGDEGVLKVVPMKNHGELEDWDDWRPPRRPRAKGWTYEIIQMLKRYPHTFADISAFAFNKKEACAALMWLLSFDESGHFDSPDGANFKLIDKLMWGSDYPMILPNFPNYEAYLKAFLKTIRLDSRKFARFQMPSQGGEPGDLPAAEVIFEKMTSVNPRRFLFE